MTWFVKRREDGSIASAHRAPQPGYAEQALADDHPDIVAMLAAAQPAARVDPDELAAALKRKGVLNDSDIEGAKRGR